MQLIPTATDAIDSLFSPGTLVYFLVSYYSGRTKYSAFVSKLSKLSDEYLSPQKTQKAAFFLFEKSWTGE
jgi:hypothetical protein